jgi:endonuclease/exonuclease/phosphatase family metal-dependent hydrolase
MTSFAPTATITPQLPLGAPAVAMMMPTQTPTALPAPTLPTLPSPRPRVAPAPSPLSSASASGDLKVMTFNLRVATALDGLNTWAMRRGMVVDRIRACDPDLLGTQEGLRRQTDYLREQLSDYTFFGVGRSDGKRRGEMCGIFYRTSRFEQIDGGHFWLSKSPEKPGSKGWGAWFPRMVTWVKLRPRDGGETIVFFNTHLDAFASRARSEGARLLVERMIQIAGGAPCVVTGDFNAGQGSDPYVKLTAAAVAPGAVALMDAFRAANPIARSNNEGTRHDFRGGRGGQRIDWILASPCFQSINASIDRSRGLLGYPSDHYPVIATLRRTPVAVGTPVARIE